MKRVVISLIIFLALTHNAYSFTIKGLSNSAILIETETSQGSGVVTQIKKIKYVITAYHVVEGCNTIKLTCLGDNSTAVKTSIDGWDKLHDIAAYRLPKKMYHIPAIKLSNKILTYGESVFVLAFPRGRASFSDGKVIKYEYKTRSSIPSDIVFTAHVDGGSSGGMIIDKRGRLVGIVTAYKYHKTYRGTVKGNSVGTPAAIIIGLAQKYASSNKLLKKEGVS